MPGNVKHYLWLFLCCFFLTGPVWAMPCDADNDGDVDLDDLNLIKQDIRVGAKVRGPGDPRDVDNNGIINSVDSSLCALRCTRTRCSTINRAPFANAGPDQSMLVGDLVQLSGAASADSDGDLLRYAWTFTSRPVGSVAGLIEAATVAPRFIADKPGQYVIQLLVNDGKGDSLPDTIIVSTENIRPIADAGPDQSVRVGTLVSLDGARSSDIDGDRLQYLWKLSTAPPGSAATVTNADSVNPSLYIDRPGNYLMALTVSDGKRSSLPDTVAISTENSPPVANAGINQSISLGTTVTLDGSRSFDVDGNLLVFRWSLLARPVGSSAVLDGANNVRPSFVADFPGTYVAQLIVNDGLDDSAPSSVTLTTGNAAPIANAGPAQTVPVSSLVTLDGSASRDPEGAMLSLAWSLIGKPVGSGAILSGKNGVHPTFSTDLAGSYIAQLIVYDGALASPPATVTVSTTNSRPAADAGLPQSVAAGTPVLLDGSASRDADGDLLSFGWSLITVPPGSKAAISGARLVSPRFVPDVPGTYVAQLIVSDGKRDSVPATVLIDVSSANRKPLAVAGAVPNNGTVGSAILLDGTGSSDPDGDPLAWAWSIAMRPGGSIASIANPLAARTSFLPDVAGTYTIQLVVRDGKSDSVPALLVVEAQAALGSPPLITSKSPTTASASVGQPDTYQIVTSDPGFVAASASSLAAAPASLDASSGALASDDSVGASQALTRVRKKARSYERKGVSAIMVSPDGLAIAATNSDGRVRVLDAAGGSAKRVLKAQGAAPAAGIVLSADGRTVVTAGRDSVAEVWSAETGERRFALRGHEHALRTVAASADGLVIATGGEETRVMLWDGSTGRLKQVLGGHTDFVNSVSVSRDGRLLASGDAAARILVWEIATGRLLHTLRGHADELNSVAFSADGKLLASAGEDGKVLLWDVVEGRQVQALVGHRAPVRSLAFNADGGLLAGGAVDGKVVVWDMATRSVSRDLATSSTAVNAVSFGGDKLYAGTEQNLVLSWSVLRRAAP
jgi:WD40 repeat protein